MLPTIAVYNESACVTDEDAQATCATIQRQLVDHLGEQSATINFAKKGEASPAGAWVIRLVDKIDGKGKHKRRRVQRNRRGV